MASKRTRSIPRTAGDVENPAQSFIDDSQDDTKPASSSVPKTEWKAFLNAHFRAVVAANRFKSLQGAPPNAEESTDGRHVGSNTDNTLAIKDVNPRALSNSILKGAHDGLVQQLNSYGVLLILLAGIMSVAILQPPGSFDSDGHIRIYKLVACYLLFASLSFLLACTGLFSVMAGSASLFNPMFYGDPSVDSEALDPNTIELKNSIIEDNVFRVKRLKTYLGFSLGLCMTSFSCGAFAVLGPLQRNLWMAIGTMVVGALVLAIEGWITWRGPALPDGSPLKKLQAIVLGTMDEWSLRSPSRSSSVQ